MIRLFYTILGCLLSCFCHGQDTLVLKNENEVLVKVLEVTPTEIKYKRLDNPDGPTYTALKQTVLMIKFENGTKEIIKSITETKAEDDLLKSTVYFLRKTGYAGSMAGYQIFIDEQAICKLNNNKFIERQIPAGIHNFSVQFYGSNSKGKAEKIEINMEPGLTYFIQVTQGGKVMTGDTWCIQIEEQEAKVLLAKLDKDNDCN